MFFSSSNTGGGGGLQGKRKTKQLFWGLKKGKIAFRKGLEITKKNIMVFLSFREKETIPRVRAGGRGLREVW